jgi:sec-independent protein translocase protein TatA
MSLGLFGPIGTTELVIILFVALLMFGGRLPEVARSLGKSVNQFKKGLKDVEDDLTNPEPPAPPKSLPPPTPTPPAANTSTSAPPQPTETTKSQQS